MEGWKNGRVEGWDFDGRLASEQKIPPIQVPISAPDSQQPQAAIAAVKDVDGFNWGYDPYHYVMGGR